MSLKRGRGIVARTANWDKGGKDMTLTIHLPKDLETRLKRQATARDISVEEIALDLLDNALEAEFFRHLKKWLPRSRQCRLIPLPFGLQRGHSPMLYVMRRGIQILI